MPQPPFEVGLQMNDGTRRSGASSADELPKAAYLPVVGLHFGVGAGPVYVGTSLNGRDATGCLQGMLMLAGLMFALLITVTVAPVAAVIAAVVLYRRGSRADLALAGLVLVTGAALALWLYPKQYGFFRYGEDVPVVDRMTTAAAEKVLHDAGFRRVAVKHHEILPIGDGLVAAPLSDKCEVHDSKPNEGARANSRNPVTLYVHCGGVVPQHFARAPQVGMGHFDQQKAVLAKAGFRNVEVVRKEKSPTLPLTGDCYVWDADLDQYDIVDTRKPVTLIVECGTPY